MKAEGKVILRLILLCGCAVFACDVIYYFADHVCNGVFADWFTQRYMYEHMSVYEGEYMLVRELFWPAVKDLIFRGLFAAAVLLTIVVFAAAYFYAKVREKKVIAQISREMRDSMQQEGNGQDGFLKEHEEILAQVSEMKSTMRHHEQILKEEMTRKNDLLTYLAHDLKTPLTSVIGYLSLLDEAPDMPERQKAKYVNIALDKAQRLEKLLNEFFDITRYNLQQVELEEETVDLSYMLIQMADEFYPLLNAHGNTINLKTDENITIHGDPVKLARVFNNILKNAIAYSYQDTAIEVWTECKENEIQICFRNKGKTIPARKLDSLFEKFFRLDEARTTNTGGAGLGLAIAKEIVALHGGAITAASENELTTFCVSLPAGEPGKQ